MLLYRLRGLHRDRWAEILARHRPVHRALLIMRSRTRFLRSPRLSNSSATRFTCSTTALDQMGVSRPAAARADGETTGHLGLGRSGEGPGFFVRTW